jgi:hypothetical protein
MSHRNVAIVLAAVLGFTLVACSGSSPVEPSGVGVLPPQPVSGSYKLAFFKSGPSGLEAVSSLPFFEELILGAHVENSSGLPAQLGTVTFEYCSRIGFPTDDITQVDEAPIEVCANGSGRWAPLVTIAVNKSGDAFMNFGFVRITPLIGFRFQYSGQGGAIASGVSTPSDFAFHP